MNNIVCCFSLDKIAMRKPGEGGTKSLASSVVNVAP